LLIIFLSNVFQVQANMQNDAKTGLRGGTAGPPPQIFNFNFVCGSHWGHLTSAGFRRAAAHAAAHGRVWRI
jgi:hypothetical protein